MGINLRLEKEEALILFEFLSKLNENLIGNQEEQKVLQILECKLEKKLEEPFSQNYKDLLEKAYRKINES